MNVVGAVAARTAGASAYAPIKRAMDIVGAGLLLIAAAPILAASLVAVWLDSGFPLLHRRRVVGRGGRLFDAYKIRTMVQDADDILLQNEALHQEFQRANKLVADPRITPVGRWLRRASIDELPQAFNVLRGDMSLVGPRMITAAELPDWGETAPLLLSIRPGLTGLWQVSGRQGLPKADRIRLDREYVRRLSLRQDLSILLRTLPAVLSGRGAY